MGPGGQVREREGELNVPRLRCRRGRGLALNPEYRRAEPTWLRRAPKGGPELRPSPALVLAVTPPPGRAGVTALALGLAAPARPPVEH